MVSPVLFEHYYDGGFLISEEEGHRSRDGGSIANSGTNDLPLDAGLVLAHAAGAVAAAAKPSGNTGNGTVGSESAGVGAQVGTYQVRFTGATTFDVYDPSGAFLGSGATGTAFSNEIDFTITAGATAFAAGDSFMLNVADNGWAPYTAATAAVPNAMGILYNRTVVPASGSKKVTIITRQCQVNQEELVWDSSIGLNGGIVGTAGTNTGNGTIGSLAIESSGTLTGGVQPFIPAGTYTAVAEDATDFVVADPTGQELGIAQVGTAFTSDEIGFTITQGSTAFAAGDSFTIVVTENGQTQALSALRAAGIIAR